MARRSPSKKERKPKAVSTRIAAPVHFSGESDESEPDVPTWPLAALVLYVSLLGCACRYVSATGGDLRFFLSYMLWFTVAGVYCTAKFLAIVHKLRHLWSDKSPSESLWSTKAFAAAAAASLIASAAGFSAFPIGAATHVWAARIAAVLALSGVHRRKLCTKDKGFVMALFACSELEAHLAGMSIAHMLWNNVFLLRSMVQVLRCALLLAAAAGTAAAVSARKLPLSPRLSLPAYLAACALLAVGTESAAHFANVGWASPAVQAERTQWLHHVQANTWPQLRAGHSPVEDSLATSPLQHSELDSFREAIASALRILEPAPGSLGVPGALAEKPRRATPVTLPEQRPPTPPPPPRRDSGTTHHQHDVQLTHGDEAGDSKPMSAADAKAELHALLKRLSAVLTKDSKQPSGAPLGKPEQHPSTHMLGEGSKALQALQADLPPKRALAGIPGVPKLDLSKDGCSDADEWEHSLTLLKTLMQDASRLEESEHAFSFLPPEVEQGLLHGMQHASEHTWHNTKQATPQPLRGPSATRLIGGLEGKSGGSASQPMGVAANHVPTPAAPPVADSPAEAFASLQGSIRESPSAGDNLIQPASGRSGSTPPWLSAGIQHLLGSGTSEGAVDEDRAASLLAMFLIAAVAAVGLVVLAMPAWPGIVRSAQGALNTLKAQRVKHPAPSPAAAPEPAPTPADSDTAPPPKEPAAVLSNDTVGAKAPQASPSTGTGKKRRRRRGARRSRSRAPSGGSAVSGGSLDGLAILEQGDGGTPPRSLSEASDGSPASGGSPGPGSSHISVDTSPALLPIGIPDSTVEVPANEEAPTPDAEHEPSGTQADAGSQSSVPVGVSNLDAGEAAPPAALTESVGSLGADSHTDASVDRGTAPDSQRMALLVRFAGQPEADEELLTWLQGEASNGVVEASEATALLDEGQSPAQALLLAGLLTEDDLPPPSPDVRSRKLSAATRSFSAASDQDSSSDTLSFDPATVQLSIPSVEDLEPDSSAPGTGTSVGLLPPDSASLPFSLPSAGPHTATSSPLAPLGGAAWDSGLMGPGPAAFDQPLAGGPGFNSLAFGGMGAFGGLLDMDTAFSPLAGGMSLGLTASPPGPLADAAAELRSSDSASDSSGTDGEEHEPGADTSF